jgi:hypothetical protein
MTNGQIFQFGTLNEVTESHLYATLGAVETPEPISAGFVGIGLAIMVVPQDIARTIVANSARSGTEIQMWLDIVPRMVDYQ